MVVFKTGRSPYRSPRPGLCELADHRIRAVESYCPDLIYLITIIGYNLKPRLFWPGLSKPMVSIER
jgi:hypothetical protein